MSEKEIPWDTISEGECHVTPYASIIHDGQATYCGTRCFNDKRTIDCIAISKINFGMILEDRKKLALAKEAATWLVAAFDDAAFCGVALMEMDLDEREAFRTAIEKLRGIAK